VVCSRTRGAACCAASGLVLKGVVGTPAHVPSTGVTPSATSDAGLLPGPVKVGAFTSVTLTPRFAEARTIGPTTTMPVSPAATKMASVATLPPAMLVARRFNETSARAGSTSVPVRVTVQVRVCPEGGVDTAQATCAATLRHGESAATSPSTTSANGWRPHHARAVLMARAPA
jgi:hypothetical protein